MLRASRTPLVEARVVLAVFVGGAVGTLTRAALAEAAADRAGHWPWTTLAVNLVGAFLLGLVVARPRWRAQRPLLGTGFCGALTTFSTLQVEVLDLPAGLAVAYAAASVAGGLAAVTLAVRLGRARP